MQKAVDLADVAGLDRQRQHGLVLGAELSREPVARYK